MQKRKKKIQQQETSLFSKVPPQAPELEEAILGALMLEKNKDTDYVLGFLQPEDFYKLSNMYIFQAILNLNYKGSPVDVLICSEELKRMNKLEEIGGPFIISSICTRVVSSSNIVVHAFIIRQKYLQRKMIELCHEYMSKAFDDSQDILDNITLLSIELSKLESLLDKGNRAISASEIEDDFEHDLDTKTSWKTGFVKFDERVTLCKNKMIMVAAATKHGKTKLMQNIQYRLHEMYTDVSTYWVTLEDDAKDILNGYLAYKTHIDTKTIKHKKFSANTLELFKPHMDRFKQFDINFIEQSAKIAKIGVDFNNFCRLRKNKLNILIIDNILSLADRNDFKDLNVMYDYIMNEVLMIKQRTNALIFIVHHFKDAQMYETNINKGYRPILSDMKGTEAFRRIPNVTLLINNPGKYDDLVAEYPDLQEVFKYLYIVDIGANRDDTSSDDKALIRFWADLSTNYFEEI